MNSVPRSWRFISANCAATPARSATSAPVGRVRSSPAHGSQRSKTWCSDAGAARLGEELGAEADQAARRHEVLHPHPAGAVVDHLLEAALAQREQLGDDADVVLGDVDREALDRLVARARRSRASAPAACRRSARSPRGASSRRAPRAASSPRPWTSQASGRSVSTHAQRDVADELLVEAAPHLARGQLACRSGRRAARC